MTYKMFDISKKSIVIIGWHGNIGSKVSEYLFQLGCDLSLIDIETKKPSWLDELQEHDRAPLQLAADVRNRNSLERCLAEILEHFGRVDAVLNLAALDTPPDVFGEKTGRFEEFPISFHEEMMGVNVTGALLVAQVFGPALANRGGGSLILFNSIYGQVSPRKETYEYLRKHGQFYFKPATYTISKSALTAFTKYLAVYWADKEVRVNQLILGGVYSNQDPEFVNSYSKNVPLRRMANTDDIFGSVVLLISDQSSYITGSAITIDGGYTAI